MFQSVICLLVCQFEPCVSISDMFVSLSVRTVCFNQCYVCQFVSSNRVFQSVLCLLVCQFEPCVSISAMFVSLSVQTVCFNQCYVC